MVDVVTEALARDKKPYRMAVMAASLVGRQSQAWLQTEVNRLCSLMWQRVINNGGGVPFVMEIIPDIAGMTAATWAGPLAVEYNLWLPWQAPTLPVALSATDPFFTDPDGKHVLAGASETTVTSSSREYSSEALVNCRRRMTENVDAVLATHSSKESGQGRALTLRATSRGIPVILIDTHSKKSAVINPKAMPDEVEDPF